MQAAFQRPVLSLATISAVFFVEKIKLGLSFECLKARLRGKSEDAVRQRLGRVNVKNCVVFLFSCGPTERENLLIS